MSDYRRRVLHIDWNDAGRIAPWEGEMMRTDAEINACRMSPDYWETDCEACPDRARCDELFGQELLRQFGTEPPEEVE